MIPEIDRIEKKLTKIESDRDRVMQLSKELIKLSGKTIAAMHASGRRIPESTIAELKAAKEKLGAADKGFEYYSVQAHQEFSEALIFYNVLKRGKIPSMGEIGETEAPYLLGLMDVVGELKREAIDAIRKGDGASATKYYGLMSDIYDSTLHMRFASSVLPDFRRKQDTARIQLEGLSSELLRIGNK